MTHPDASEVVARLRRFFAGNPAGAAAVWLFGSVARGTARSDSDVDVGVSARVQVVVLNRAPVDLVHRVLRDGILVCEQDASHRIRFEVRARK